ncbi:MAG: hypothetical protein WCP85_26100 [Mariniphaga sp.]
MRSGLFVSGIILLILIGCVPSQQELAVKKISVAEGFLTKGDTAIALLHLDSIPRVYPEAVLEIKRASKISNQINTLKINVLFDKKEKVVRIIDLLIKEFSPDKGEFEKYTNYIHNSQGIDNGWSRSYVQVIVNQMGDLSLMSNYYGSSWINHTSMWIQVDGITNSTDSVPLNNINNHHNEFNGANWEKVTYRSPQAEKVIETIASSSDKKLKVYFKGKSSFAVWVEETDKKAIKSAWELSKALKVKVAAEKAISELEKKMKPE